MRMRWRELAACSSCGLRCRDSGMHDEALDDAEEAFEFLEQYPVDKKVLRPYAEVYLIDDFLLEPMACSGTRVLDLVFCLGTLVLDQLVELMDHSLLGDYHLLVPYLGLLPVALYPGRVIVIEGMVLPNAIRMSVNLSCGSSPLADLAFHLNPRFDQKVVVRNYRVGNIWDEEETASPRKFPFKRNESFHLQLFSTSEEFLVAVNGHHFCAYTYRLPLIRVQTVQVNGDVEIESLEYKKCDEYPEPMEGTEHHNYRIPRLGSLANIAKKPMETPFTALLPNGFDAGSEMEIRGRVKLLPHSFYINLQDGPQIWPHPIIPFHMNPRFGPKASVVRNAWLKGKWGAEERVPIFQFRPGRPFVLKIVVAKDQFVVSVDGSLMADLKHRSSTNLINTVYIQGDVWINDIIIR